MGPVVKDSDILKTVKDNNRQKLLKYLSPEKGLGSIKRFGVEENQSIPGGRIRLKLKHVNVDCHEDETGYTPLIIAVLNGNKDIVEDLIFHSADVDEQDVKGNTALHMSVFGGKIELVDILFQYKAKVNVQNSDGNTPLHIACQTDTDNRVHIMLKLLQKNGDHTLCNKDKKTPLDVAAMFGKTDAVSVLLDHDHNLEDSKRKSTLSNTLALVEAAMRGYKEVVEMFLDYGYDANVVDTNKDTTALIEAVRFVRFQVVESLLKYGARTDVQNSKCESPESLVETYLPKPVADKMRQMFDDYKKSGATETPRFLKILSRGTSLQGIKDYPNLPNDKLWTKNNPDYCNSCTPNAPNTNILDADMCKCWIAAEVHQAWTVLDLRYEHTITGITIYGWDSPQMVRSFELQRGKTLMGPWSTVIPGKCIRSGETSLSKQGFPQTFTDFTARSRFWRLLLVDNHGGKCICFQGIRLYGADDRIRILLKENDMDHYDDDIIALGFNTYKKFLLITEDQLKEVVKDDNDRSVILKSLERDRPKEFHPATLSWLQTPVVKVKQGEIIPDFKVKSLPGVKTKIKVVINEDVPISGTSEVILQSNSSTEPSEATFSGLSIDTVGHHVLTVKCIDYPRVTLSTPQPIEINPKPALRQSVAMAFDDMESMLKDLTDSLGPITE
ncbi:hypothetical protein ACF0H5_015107 [Mactra antiquata]